jgi:hypothetical protein
MDLIDSGLAMLWSWGFWVVMIIVVLTVSLGALYLRKKRKYQYKAILLTDLGDGKQGINTKLKCGWFKSQKYLFGLLDTSGERQLELNDGRIIRQASTEDFHEINFKRGILCAAKPDDPKVVLPIDKAKLTNKNLMLDIAPADFRDTSSKILQENEKELKDSWSQIATMVTFGILAIILFISIILVIQYSNARMDAADELYIKAITETQNMVRETANIIANQLNTAPPVTNAP